MMQDCSTCERRSKKGCKVFTSKLKKCWAWTDDPDWEKKVKKAVEKYKNRKKLIYVCSPLRGDIERNIKRASEYSRYVFKQGHIPITPHLYLTTFLDDTNPEERTAGMKMGIELLNICNELWIFGKHISEGMFKEINAAEYRGIPVRRNNVL